MNKTQLSKIVRYLFIEQQYGVKEINQNDIWLLKLNSDFPIVCVILNEYQDENYYKQKYDMYAKLLNVTQPVLLINTQKHQNAVFVYDKPLETTFINKLISQQLFYSDFPDYTLPMLQMRYQYKFGYIRWITLVIGFISIFFLFNTKVNLSLDLAFLNGGYFRYTILNWKEYYRIVTMIFLSNNAILTFIYLLALYRYEYTMTLEYSRNKFVGLIVINTLITSLLLIILNVEVVNVGLTSLITCLSVISLLKYAYLRIKYRNIRSRVSGTYLLLNIFLLAITCYNDINSFNVGFLTGIVFFWYDKVKDDKFLKINFSIAISILIVILGYIFTQQINYKQINKEIEYRLKHEKIRNEYYRFKIDKMEKEYAR